MYSNPFDKDVDPWAAPVKEPITFFKNLEERFAIDYCNSPETEDSFDNDFSHWLKEWYGRQEEEPPVVQGLFEHRAFRKELRRLSENPSQFPNKLVEILFWMCFSNNPEGKTLKRLVGSRAKSRRIILKAQRSFSKRRVKFLNPKHQSNRSMWEQFLHNRAPGASACLRGRDRAKYIQILPTAGLQILSNNLKEYKTIVEAIEKASIDPSCFLYYHTYQS